jgi:DNA-binding response OmpR family regulator
MKTLLLVENEPNILGKHRRFFETEGFHVLTAASSAEVRELLTKEQPDAIVLDTILPDGNGLDVLTELRASGSKIPVMMLTGWDRTSDIVRGLKLGANDYMSKPFDTEELLARLEAMLRNVEQVPEVYVKEPFVLKLTSTIALLNGEDILLSQKEFSLLLLFLQNEGKTMNAEYLYEKVWGHNMTGEIRAVRQRISNLRDKIDGCGYVIVTVRKDGYRFERG